MDLRRIAPLIERIVRGKNLDAEEARLVLSTAGDEDAITDSYNSDGYFLLAFTVGLMAKGPTANELLGCARSLVDHTPAIPTTVPGELLTDTAGTGGASIKTFNVGSTTAFVLAAAGLKVAKQSTRAYTSSTGSADLFQALGINPFSISQETVQRCLESVGVVPFYTPQYSSAFRNRINFLTKLKAIGLVYPTPWHLVSWIPSPFQLHSRVYGVMAEEFVDPVAEVFRGLGYDRVMVVHGIDGLDEVSNVGTTRVAEVSGEEIIRYTLTPDDFGVEQARVEDIALQLIDSDGGIEGATALSPPPAVLEGVRQESLRASMRILYGQETGPKLSLVLVNAAASLRVAGLVADLPSGVELARTQVTSGAAAAKVEALVREVGDSRVFERFMSGANLQPGGTGFLR